jgi:hypothetical protein
MIIKFLLFSKALWQLFQNCEAVCLNLITRIYFYHFVIIKNGYSVKSSKLLYLMIIEFSRERLLFKKKQILF